jgi:ABC-type bacteriocin/lantibiotic exporter with double-glycine peptidase domain
MGPPHPHPHHRRAGLWVRGLNLRVRQALGRMFGFTLDAFSKVDTVGALGLEHRLVADYKGFATDYFQASWAMNVSLHAHRAFTTALGAGLRLTLLWCGGAALFADMTTGGWVGGWWCWY